VFIILLKTLPVISQETLFVLTKYLCACVMTVSFNTQRFALGYCCCAPSGLANAVIQRRCSGLIKNLLQLAAMP
jgi:hypothetical protein